MANREKVEAVTNFISLGSKMTAVMKLKDTCPWKKSYDKPRQRIKKQIHCFANKCLYSQSYGLTIAMYECESWTIKKAEHQKIDAFELWC